MSKADLATVIRHMTPAEMVEYEAILDEQDRREAAAREAEAERTAAADWQAARGSLIRLATLRNPKYQVGWFHRNLAAKLEKFADDVRNRRSPRLIVNVPPQYGKSELCTRSFIPWYLGNNPSDHIILGCFAADLATRMSTEARQTVEEAVRWWPQFSPGPQWTSDFWRLQRGGSLRAAGRGGGISGMPAHILLIDDPMKDEEEARSPATMRSYMSWFETAATARLQDGGGILIVSTRWGVHDPVGYHLETAKLPGVLPWEVVCYPAIAETDEYDGDTLLRRAGEPLSVERYSLETMQQRKAATTPWRWASVYQQRPVPEEGGIFTAAHFSQRYEALPPLDGMAISGDLTFKGTNTSDFVVLQVWGWKGALCYLVDQVRARMTYPAAKQALKDLRAKYPQATTVIIEDKANGSAMVDELRPTMPGIVAWDPGKTDKRGRVELYSLPRYAAQQVFFPASEPWMHDFVTEHLGFLAGAANDDQVDAESQFFAWLSAKGGKERDWSVY